MRRVSCFVLGVGLLGLTARGSDWPQFRGPGGLGIAADSNTPTEWSADKNVKWKATLPGAAWSCPVVVGDKLFVTTAITEKQTKPRGGPGGGGGGGGGRPGGPPGG